MHQGDVLISGASFAGLASAFWLTRSGYKVTLVEVGSAIREGGTPVNIKGDTVRIVERMGLLRDVVANRIETHSVEIRGRQGRIARSDTQRAREREGDGVEYEIERDFLTHLMFDLVKNDVEFMFDDSIMQIEDGPNVVDVKFKTGQPRLFDLVFGCDGFRSNVRDIWFRKEAVYSKFLKSYGSVTILPRLLIEQGARVVFQVPGRMVSLCAYNGKTDIITLFSSNDRIDYDHRDRAQQIAIVSERFDGAGWRIPELLSEIERADNFYFSDLSQIRMPEWTRGRVALVGDAAYCASAAAGMGGSLAINGATALGDAIAGCDGDHVAAFRAYNDLFRPVVTEVQARAVSFCEGLAAGIV